VIGAIIEIGANLNAYLNTLTILILGYLTRRAIRAEKHATAAASNAAAAKTEAAAAASVGRDTRNTVEHVERIVNGEEPPSGRERGWEER
jgi:hypothetical protein